eukprot:scaffold88753_cov45-Phaeocystis_antarctica.AAC.2
MPPSWSISMIFGFEDACRVAAISGVHPTKLALFGSAPKASRIRTWTTASRLHAARRGVIPVTASAALTFFFLSVREKPSRYVWRSSSLPKAARAMQRVSSHIIACMLGKVRTGMSFGMCTSLLILELRTAQQAMSIAAPGSRTETGAEKCRPRDRQTEKCTQVT